MAFYDAFRTYRIRFEEARPLAVVMSTQARLGQASPLATLPVEVVRRIATYACE